jgi:protein subunit release factor B
MVKDHRTGVKSSQPDKILDGDLSKFINEERETCLPDRQAKKE